MCEDLSHVAKTDCLSENKYFLKDRCMLDDWSIVAIRMVKYTLNNIDVTDFPMS